ncbi:uncharacterized protein LOC129230493 [Uloborus diversus]|uniref:uncharacterized protein LOC129230493 n=1 Tax=Uloborus diversus TaxID=327109 RepID=UPI002409DC99|nr:uncharacterized protein LOC129230493 [Uloborus diversus]
MVYGSSLRLPGEFFQPMDTSIVLDPTKFVHKLRDCMSSLKPVPTSAHCKRSPFVQKDLLTSTHVFLRIDSLRKSLEPTYSGPHEVLARQEKTFRIKINNKEAVVSIDRLKPAFLWVTDTGSTPSPPVQPEKLTPASLELPTSAPSKTTEEFYTTRSGRRVRFHKYS